MMRELSVEEAAQAHAWYSAALDQGLAPIMGRLKCEGIDTRLDVTGGHTMVVAVDAGNGMEFAITRADKTGAIQMVLFPVGHNWEKEPESSDIHLYDPADMVAAIRDVKGCDDKATAIAVFEGHDLSPEIAGHGYTID